MTNNHNQFELHLPVTESIIAVDFIAQACDLSKQQIKLTMQKGAVWVSKANKTQRLRRAKRALKTGETIHLYYDRAVLERASPVPELIEDIGQYSIWNKPYGMLSQGSKWGDHCTITRWAEQHLKPQRQAFVVHRLDRAANGLIIVAHEKKAAAALSALFQSREIDKRYRIWVEGKFEQEKVSVDLDIDGRKALSHFELLKYEAEQNRSLLDVKIETGRKHQIRRHVASLGYPVVGDRLYGTQNSQENLQLQAYFLGFYCPISGELKKFNLLK